MYEYKVLTLTVKKFEKVLNQFAKEGWRLVTASPNIAIGAGLISLVMTLKREVSE